MERVLDVYRRRYDPAFPVVCMDEAPRQLVGEARAPIPAAPGLRVSAPERLQRVHGDRAAGRVARDQGDRPADQGRLGALHPWHRPADPDAQRITLLMDNLSTHRPGALYESFPPAQAKALWDRFEFVYTPKHGSWLNVAEVELNVLIRQCLNRRLDSIEVLRSEVAAWQAARERSQAKVDWQFTTADARIKLKRLYPTLDE